MSKPRLVLCGPVEGIPQNAGEEVVKLNTTGNNANVNLRLEDVAKVMLGHVSERFVDFVEIAAYIFATDSSTGRGKHWTPDAAEELWGRKFRLVIAVRDIAFWSDPNIIETLQEVLRFLSDDDWSISFQKMKNAPSLAPYLSLGTLEEWPFYRVERVIMFSGGLDSLAGVIEAASSGAKCVLVSHRSVTTMDKRQRDLFKLLNERYPNQLFRIPVWVNKSANIHAEHSQRTRSFLFAALGAVVASSIQAAGVRFYENGVVSLNLPVADEVLRARASRTTNPVSLVHLEKLCSLVSEKDFKIDNPFIFKTKAEIVGLIATHGRGDLIPYTCSCAHSMFKSKTQWHCGGCSQCIDRRVATLAAGQQANDNSDDYSTDVFVGPRKPGYERNMAVNYARHVFELDRMHENEFLEKFNLELSRAARCFSNPSNAAGQFVEMHKRHATLAKKVLEEQVQRHIAGVMDGSVPDSSLVAALAERKHRTSPWREFANHISNLLTRGVPAACRSEKPRTEPDLQEICDGILQAQNGDLVREFPFVRWASASAKPDWSSALLWIELKYIRIRADVAKITEDIAADITKYGDNGRQTLFVVYDPNHHISDDSKFIKSIERHEGMVVTIIR